MDWDPESKQEGAVNRHYSLIFIFRRIHNGFCGENDKPDVLF